MEMIEEAIDEGIGSAPEEALEANTSEDPSMTARPKGRSVRASVIRMGHSAGSPRRWLWSPWRRAQLGFWPGGAVMPLRRQRTLTPDRSLWWRPRRRPAIVGLLAIALLIVTALAGAVPAAAHSTDQPYLYVYITESGIDGRAELAIGDVETVLDLDLSGDDVAVEAALRRNVEVLHRYLGDHLAISADGMERPLEFGSIDLFREGSTDLAFVVVQYTAGAHTSIPTELNVLFEPFFEEIPGT